jgi:hypothetical protein
MTSELRGLYSRTWSLLASGICIRICQGDIPNSLQFLEGSGQVFQLARLCRQIVYPISGLPPTVLDLGSSAPEAEAVMAGVFLDEVPDPRSR